jgi:hypothetical protein
MCNGVPAFLTVFGARRYFFFEGDQPEEGNGHRGAS